MEQQELKKPVSMPKTLSAESGASCVLDAEGHCITCSDEALPARIIQIDQVSGLALVQVRGDQEVEVDTTLVEEVGPGDWLLIHGGVAIGLLEEEQAGEEK